MKTLRLEKCRIVPGTHYGTPKEVWGFRTKPARGRPQEVAREFLAANSELLGLEGIRRDLRLRRIIMSLGARHVIFNQQHEGLRIHRAYVTVHLGHDHRVYLAKNRAMPRDLLPEREKFHVTSSGASRRALRSVRATAMNARILGVERLWFPLGDHLRLAFKVRVHRVSPREEWLVYVDGSNGRILSRYDNLSHARGRARVFDPNPVIALGDWRPLVGATGHPRKPPAEAYSIVVLRDLAGTGYVDGRWVTTRPTKHRVRNRDLEFLFDSSQPGFEETMVYFHVDRAIRHLESMGYRGARALFETPLPADVHGTKEDNSWYSPGYRSFTFGTGGVDDAEDGETILHEFGHALQDAICPDFGQSAESAAMGEGFGDYFAASFFAARKPARFRPTVMSWDAITYGGDPPCLRRLDEPATYESFDHSPGADEHDNGTIWSATLWDIWRALGREIADRIVIESHFQLDAFTTFARGARAILDADRNLYGGKHLGKLRDLFHARGVGPVQ